MKESTGIEDDPSEVDDKQFANDVGLLGLPDVVLFKILSHFSVVELCQISNVCRKLYDYAHDPVLWKVLDFSGIHISADCFRRLLQNATLCEELSVAFGNSVDSSLLIEIAKTCGPTLRKLKVPFCKAFNVGILEHFVARCSHLQSINFEGCERLCLTAKSLADFEENANRKDFTNSHPSSSLVADASFYSSCSLSALPYLRSINLSHCVMVQNDELLNLVSHLECLERLNIDGILNVRDNLVVALCERHKSRLTHLFLDGENLTGGCAGALGSCERLRALGISFMQEFDDESLQHINKLHSLEMLRMRKLASVSLAGLNNLFADGRLKNLRQFEVTECQSFTNEAVASLVSSCGTLLQVLVLSWAYEIDDVGLQTIVHGCPSLRRLDLSGLFRIRGHVFTETAEKLPHLVFLNLEQCNEIDDSIIESLVLAKPDICVVDYYGEMSSDSVKRSEVSEYECF